LHKRTNNKWICGIRKFDFIVEDKNIGIVYRCYTTYPVRKTNEKKYNNDCHADCRLVPPNACRFNDKIHLSNVPYYEPSSILPVPRTTQDLTHAPSKGSGILPVPRATQDLSHAPSKGSHG
jgi:hypothetical protein